MNSGRKQLWQQATALVSLSTAGATTGIAFAHGTLADVTSPTSMPAHLVALKKPAGPGATGDAALRSAIVGAAQYYLRLAQGRTPAQMEALIWQEASTDGADHGASCAAFASLTLEAGAQATGQQSWVTGGASYPWPLHEWADARVDPNPQSPGIISIVQDAETHHRWHPLGDGYTPQPGDWVLFAGHVEVVTKYSGGVLYTIGGDSMPNLSVNAHEYDEPLAAQGVTGFVDNGQLPSSGTPAPAVAASASSAEHELAHGSAGNGQADIPGMVVPAGGELADGVVSDSGPAATAGARVGSTVLLGTAAIPGARALPGSGLAGSASQRYGRSQGGSDPQPGPGTAAQQAFIQQVAAGAVAAQRQYGVPAAVTIAQAIDESGWGQSQLAAQDNNLFGIKGSGPAGSVLMPTQEYENGQWVTIDAPFRVYYSVAESINDHGLLLATSSAYQQAMADRADPDAFANALTGVYATDPNYGANLIAIMRLYNLYRYDGGAQAAPTAASGTAPKGGGGQSGAAVDTGAVGESTQGVAGYGPALGGSGGVATWGHALQSTSSTGAAIPGSVWPAKAGTGVPAHKRGGSGPATAGATDTGAVRARTEAASGVHQGTGSGQAPATPTVNDRTGHGTAGAGTAGSAAAHSAAAGAPRQRTSAGASGATSASRGGAAAGTAETASGHAGAAGTAGTASGRAGAAGTAETASRRAGAAGTAGTASRGGAAAGTPGTARRQGTPAGTAGTSGGDSAGVGAAQLGAARIPGLPAGSSGTGQQPGGGRSVTAGPRNVRISTRRYVSQIPQTVTTAFITTAKTPLLRYEPLYQDVASDAGVHWQLLAACDWMQCRALPRVSPVYGEKLGTKNADGTAYRTKSEALKQCARDLITLASAVYGIELTERLQLSVRDLAKVFAAFRWGGLLATHHISAMEFPYSVEGLTAQHVRMRWPAIPGAPGADRPGTRFPMAFGAVPVVLSLDYRAIG